MDNRMITNELILSQMETLGQVSFSGFGYYTIKNDKLPLQNGENEILIKNLQNGLFKVIINGNTFICDLGHLSVYLQAIINTLDL